MKKGLKLLKALCLTLTVGAVCLTLTACNGNQTVRDSGHTIVFYNTMGDKLQKPLQSAIDAFQTKFPGWKVESVQPGGYDEVKSKVISDLSAGTQPDLAYCYADHVAQYIPSGKVVNMGAFINNTNKLKTTVLEGENWVEKEFDEVIGYSEAEIADFVPGYYAEGFASNYAKYSEYGFAETDMLTMPFQKSTEVLFYNANALKELGEVDADGNVVVPDNWDDLWRVCKLAKTKWPSCTPLGYDSESNWFITTCQQNGWGYTSADENHYLFNNENTKAWLADLQVKYKEGLFTTSEIYDAYTSNLFVKGVEAGGTLFTIGSSGGASYQATDKFVWGVAPIPGAKQADGTIKKAAISQGPSLVMLKTSAGNTDEKQLMTWEFMKILLDPVYQCKFAGTSGYMPSRVSAYDVPEYQELLSDTSNIVVATVLCAKSMNDIYFTSPAFNGSSNARDQVGSVIIYVATGVKTPAKALDEAYKRCGGK